MSELDIKRILNLKENERMYSERMKNEGKVRVFINGHRKYIDKNIAEKFKDKEA